MRLTVSCPFSDYNALPFCRLKTLIFLLSQVLREVLLAILDDQEIKFPELSNGTELCAVVSTSGSWHLELKERDGLWVMFNCFSVVLHVD